LWVKKKSIGKRLLYGEVLESQFKVARKKIVNPKTNIGTNSKQTNQKKTLLSIFAGSTIKRYRLIGAFSSLLSYKEHATVQRSRDGRKKRADALSNEVKTSVINFMNEDCNSHCCPGKRDAVSEGRVKVQKQILLDTIKGLHQKYCDIHEHALSYSAFRRLKPSSIVEPRAADRETCLCTKHSNIQLIVDRLYQMKIVREARADDLCKDVCCDVKSKNCMLRQCKECSNKRIPCDIGTDRENDTITFYQWQTRVEEKMIKNKLKSIKLVEKAQTYSTKSKLVDELNQQMQVFPPHVFAIRDQYTAMKNKRDSLTESEVLFHCDFSENYVLKYGSEIQSMYFGASKRQIALHTGVLYYRENGNIKTLSFCTLSDHLDHGSCCLGPSQTSRRLCT